MTNGRTRWRSTVFFGVLGVAALALGGCSTLLAVRGQQRLADTTCVVSGTVRAEKPTGAPLVVVLLAIIPASSPVRPSPIV